MALLLSGEENQGPASDAYEVCVCKGWAEGRTVTAAGLEALKPYKVRNAVIMAAGFSSRFAPLSYECPKGLVKIKGEVLVERQIRQLQEAGILEIIVVVGYRKEDFYYLAEKFGVEIVENSEYSTRNNHSSLMAVKERLSNTYVCSVDNYFTVNPFRSYEWKAFYSAQWSEGETSEWCMRSDDTGRISEVQIGGRGSFYMVGAAYFDIDFSRKLLDIISSEYFVPSSRSKLWEDFFVEHLDSLDMEMKCFSEGCLLEFDSIDDAKSFDPVFLKEQQSEILDRITACLGCQREDIHSIVSLKSGLTNLSCCFSVGEQEFVYRHPGVGTEKLVDRKGEFVALECAARAGLDGTFLAADPEKGWKLSRYIKNARFLNLKSPEEMKKGMQLLRRLHGLKERLPRKFNFFDQGLKYEAMLSTSSFDVELKERIAQACRRLEKSVPCVTHNDFWPANILVDESDGIHLIDWEYAGMGDYANDFGSFSVSSQLDDNEADRALEFYFERKPTVEERIHNYTHVALAGWCWYNWALLKEEEGASVGGWTNVYKSYAERYLNRVDELLLLRGA